MTRGHTIKSEFKMHTLIFKGNTNIPVTLTLHPYSSLLYCILYVYPFLKSTLNA